MTWFHDYLGLLTLFGYLRSEATAHGDGEGNDDNDGVCCSIHQPSLCEGKGNTRKRGRSREGESTVGSDALSASFGLDTKQGIGWRTENKILLGKGAK